MYKKDFPIFENDDLIYLDSAATSQKPKTVIDAVSKYYENYNANTGRSAYKLAETSTEMLESARVSVQNFINAKHDYEIIFTKSTTESINLVAYSYLYDNLNKDDEVAVLISEHHANLLPWQNICKMKSAKLVYLYFDENFIISDSEINTKINSKTKFVACSIVSNVLGIINPVEKIIKRAHDFGAVVMVDAAQSIAHYKSDVLQLDCDFLAFSGHKMYAPMGVGVLYGKEKLLNKMNPFLLGGGMVEYVYEDSVTFNTLPYKFEGGTPNVASIVGLHEAIKYIENIGYQNIEIHQKELFEYTTKKLKSLDFVSIIGDNNPNRTSIISIIVSNIHSHDVASILDSKYVCIRSGNHCAQPLLRKLEINSTARISFGIYNETKDIDKLIDALIFAKELFSGGHSKHV